MLTINLDMGLISIDLDAISTGRKPCFIWEEYKLWLHSYPDKDRYHRENFHYTLMFQGKTLFRGSDYNHYRNNHSIEHITGLLGFLSLQDGDTDKKYFKDYTPKQLSWRDSSHCDNLKMLVFDLEDMD